MMSHQFRSTLGPSVQGLQWNLNLRVLVFQMYSAKDKLRRLLMNLPVDVSLSLSDWCRVSVKILLRHQDRSYSLHPCLHPWIPLYPLLDLTREGHTEHLYQDSLQAELSPLSYPYCQTQDSYLCEMNKKHIQQAALVLKSMYVGGSIIINEATTL